MVELIKHAMGQTCVIEPKYLLRSMDEPNLHTASSAFPIPAPPTQNATLLTLESYGSVCPTNVSSDSKIIIGENTNTITEKNFCRKAFLEETKKQLCLAGPLILSSLLVFSVHIISLMFVGHLGELPLAAASLATSFAYVTGFYILLGLASTLETICGQSYGAKQYHMVGIHTQRAIVILLLMSIPIAIIWANTETILVACKQNHAIAAEAGPYVKLMIPSLLAYSVLQCIFRFMQTQNIVIPMMVSSGVTTILHIAICWTLVYKCGLGIKGAALANTITYYVNAVSLVSYVKFSSSCSETWVGFSMSSLHGIRAYIKLAVPSTIMLCLEFWSFEMIVLLSGLLPNPKLETSVLAISLNVISILWVIPDGLGGAVSTRVSNELGAGNQKKARLAVAVVLVITISEGILVGLLLIVLRHVWAYAYTDETEVVKRLASLTPLLAAINFMDGLTCTLSGVARGCGWQKIGAYINLGSYYIVGIPVAILLAFPLHIGGKGLWLGFLCAVSIHAVSFLTITVRTKWDREAKKATQRNLEAECFSENASKAVTSSQQEFKLAVITTDVSHECGHR